MSLVKIDKYPSVQRIRRQFVVWILLSSFAFQAMAMTMPNPMGAGVPNATIQAEMIESGVKALLSHNLGLNLGCFILGKAGSRSYRYQTYET